MQAHDVGPGEHGVVINELNALKRSLRWIHVTPQHPHAERPCYAGYSLADAAQPDDSHRQALKLYQRVVPVTEVLAGAPAPLAHCEGVMAHVVGELKQKRENGLSHRFGGVVRHVGNGYIPLPRRFHIHHVVAGRRYADVFQVRQPFYLVPPYNDFVRDDDIGLPSPLQDFIGRGALVDLAVPQARQRLPRKITRIQRVAIEHHDSHGRRSTFRFHALPLPYHRNSIQGPCGFDFLRLLHYIIIR